MAPQENSQTLEKCDEQYALSISSGSLAIAEESITYSPTKPQLFGEISAWERMESRLPEVLPATRVVGIPNGIVVGSASWVVTPDLKVVVPLSWYESVESKPSLSKVTWNKMHYVKGNVLNLGTISGWNNYGHFLLDGIGRLSVLELTGKTISDFDRVVVPGFSSPSANRLLETVGISSEKIIRLSAGEALYGDALYTPSLPGTSRIYRACLPEFFRSQVSSKLSDKKIFISRPAGRRPISNIEELENCLTQHDFEIVDPHEVFLPQLIAEADVVVGAHGAALADIAFAKKGTKVIELIPSDHMFPYYYSLATAGELEYRLVLGKSEYVRELDESGPSPHPFEVDIDAFELALNK